MPRPIRKNNPSISDAHTNTPLTNIAVAFEQSEATFISSKAFPTVGVDKKSDAYYVWDRGDMNRDEAMEVGPGGEAPISGLRLSSDSYFCRVYKLAHLIADQDRAAEDSIVAQDAKKTRDVMRKLLIKREKLWASRFFTTGKWTGSTTGTDITPGVLWDVYATSNPITDIRAQVYSLLRLVPGCTPADLTLTVGPLAWLKIIDHPQILERIDQVMPGVLNEQIVAQVLGIGRVVVPMATENTAKEGATAVMAFINGKAALLTYAPSSPAIDAPSAGYTFAWKGLTGSNDGIRIKRFRREVRESDQIEGQIAFDQKLVSSVCGVFFTGVVS